MYQENRSVILTLTREETANGCQKEVFCQGMYSPILVTLHPGLQDGQQLYLDGVAFVGDHGSVQHCRLELIVRVQKKKRVGAIVALSVVFTLLLVAAAGIYAIHVLRDPVQNNKGDSLFYQGDPVDPSQIIANYEQRYYLSQIDPELQQAAAMLYQTAMSFESQCTLPKGIDKKELSQIALLLKAECPELFQLDMGNNVVYSYISGTDEVYSVELKYSMSQADYIVFRKECEERIAEILQGTGNMTAWEKENHIFDILAMDISYSAEAKNCENAYGALIGGEAKCDGIALAMKWCLEEAGMECLCILGEPKEGEIGHAWNMVKLDGKYYNLDLTASARRNRDTQFSDTIFYVYYNFPDQWLEEDYIVNDAFCELVDKPVCETDTKGYYASKGLYITEKMDLRDAFAQQVERSLDTGRPVSFQLESEILLDKLCDHLNEYFDYALKDYYVSHNFQMSYMLLDHNVIAICVW